MILVLRRVLRRGGGRCLARMRGTGMRIGSKGYCLNSFAKADRATRGKVLEYALLQHSCNLSRISAFHVNHVISLSASLIEYLRTLKERHQCLLHIPSCLAHQYRTKSDDVTRNTLDSSCSFTQALSNTTQHRFFSCVRLF
jgi:hypothetical protein